MQIHREGSRILMITIGGLVLLNAAVKVFWPAAVLVALGLSAVLFVVILQFFRHPERTIPVMDDNTVYAPADGKVVVIEEVDEPEYFKDRRLQVSIFMSPVNVHVNRNPVGGKVAYVQYHPGKYLVAWHPKSSTENERTTVVIETEKHPILIRQIAGAMAKRIRTYLTPGQTVRQGDELGFITFGSRVDILLPLNATTAVNIGQTVRANKTVIANLTP